jgi:glycosyltransferase involved in cell wall biosynthesis
MNTLHLVYPHGPRISTPDAIGRHLAERLAPDFRVRHHNWDSCRPIYPEPGDCLVGHAHPYPWTCFRLSLRQPGWRRRILLQPYVHGDNRQAAYLDSVIPQCDWFLSITGRHWFTRVDESPFAHWRPKMIHVDLAVDRREFPPVKTAFSPPGHRRLVYVGHTAAYKNTPYLSQIAAELPECQFSWIGSGRKTIHGVRAAGALDFATEGARNLLGHHDFMITVGRADANPTTILEAMAWGLIPICTPESGYEGYPDIINIPLDAPAEAARIIRHWQAAPDADLHAMQRRNWELLDRHFTWARLGAQVRSCLQDDTPPPAVFPAPFFRHLNLRWLAVTAPGSPLRLRELARWRFRQLHQSCTEKTAP